MSVEFLYNTRDAIDDRSPHVEYNVFQLPQSEESYFRLSGDGLRMRGCAVIARREYERLCAPPTFRAWLAGLWSRVRWPLGR